MPDPNYELDYPRNRLRGNGTSYPPNTDQIQNVFVPETYILHLPDSCRFLNCSVSISIFCHVVWQSWPNHMAEYGNGRELLKQECGRYLENMYVKSVPSIGYFLFWVLELLPSCFGPLNRFPRVLGPQIAALRSCFGP